MAMIQANDLRIGNILQSYEGSEFEYVVIQSGDILMCQEANENFNNWRKPIPITEEWLLRFGFEKLPHKNLLNSLNIDLGRNRILSVSNVGTGNEMVWICEVSITDKTDITDLVCLRNYDYDGRTMVHHIQNIYQSIKGEELTTKP